LVYVVEPRELPLRAGWGFEPATKKVAEKKAERLKDHGMKKNKTDEDRWEQGGERIRINVGKTGYRDPI